ncbi:FAD-dependent oxidoreductase [Hydrogenophaga sp.]|jgi:tRNA 5-methylaminomethyl-2-thiouridine biosynthesis bifunctional protein|uniref:FAD-dependent oxidoreductase n=1 Tax=Hydrogenophaga sp. TaxID=1904254 RepID=UPI0025C1763B|nr:FAD-dependent oxidoreductase [Hydrogenophaga sp.]
MPDARRHALVIGAGLAGAAATSALALRGWSITLLDAAGGPAQRASGLPVGMLSPHVTRTPTPLSRLSALGVAHTLAELQRLVPRGAGWQACEVDNLGHDPGRWPATLVRPAALVHAWLQEAQALGALSRQWNTAVQRLTMLATGDPTSPTLWQAWDAQGRCVGEAPVVVVAAALGSSALLANHAGPMSKEDLPLNPVKGQMSLGAQQGEPLAARPQRNDGVFVPQYRDLGLPPEWPGSIWSMGSTFERGAADTKITAEAHERNARSLQTIHPLAAEGLRTALAQERLLGWSQVRCASLDRLPLVGAAPDAQALRQQQEVGRAQRRRVALADVPRWPGLHLLCALGSRGITLGPWCAAQLALQIDGASSPVDPALMAALDPARFAVKNARRQGGSQALSTAG